MAGTITEGDGQAVAGIAPAAADEAEEPDGRAADPATRPPFTIGVPPGAANTPSAGPGSRRPTGLARLRAIRWTTPTLLRAALGTVLVLILALGAVCALVPTRTASGWNVVDDQMAPQVEHSAGLYLSLTDMDAQTANILEFGDTASLAANRATALKVYGRDRDEVSSQLQGATKAAGNDPAAQAALLKVLDGLGQYEDYAARATALNDQARASEGHPDPQALAAYRQATDLMRTALLPAAYRLINADDTAYTATYDQERATLSDLRTAVLVLGLATLAVLAAAQLFLARRFRRRINPGLAAATLLCVTVLGTVVGICGDEREYLRYTRHDAFDSVVALSVARAVGYDANADESRALLDASRYDQYAGAFLTASQRITRLDGATLPAYASDVAAAQRAYRARHTDLRFTGYLGDEFRNITFPGERAAAERALTAWVVYQRDDHETRADLAAGRLGQAIGFNTSYAAGGSNYEFGRWDSAMSADVAINEKAFEGGVRDGRGDVGIAWLVVLAGCPLALAAAVFGVRPRLGEFRRLR